MGKRLRTATAALDLHLVAALVQAGAEAAAADARGWTPLHALAVAAVDDVAAAKAAPILRILLARGAQVSIPCHCADKHCGTFSNICQQQMWGEVSPAGWWRAGIRTALMSTPLQTH